MRLRKRIHPRPTRRKPPCRAEKTSAPQQLSKAGARGLIESLSRNSPKTPKYYHIPQGTGIRASDIAAIVICVALALTVLWSFSCVHRLGYEAGRGEGWSEGYDAGVQAASAGPGL